MCVCVWGVCVGCLWWVGVCVCVCVCVCVSDKLKNNIKTLVDQAILDLIDENNILHVLFNSAYTCTQEPL